MHRLQQIEFSSAEYPPRQWHRYLLMVIREEHRAIVEILALTADSPHESHPPFETHASGVAAELDLLRKAEYWLVEQHHDLQARVYPVTMSNESKDRLQKWIDLAKGLLRRE